MLLCIWEMDLPGGKTASSLSAMAEQRIANVSEVDAGRVVVFTYRQDGIRREGILLQAASGLVAYENTCRHLPVKLDAGTRQFLTREKQHLICQSHGALYEPDTGYCFRGPCEGASLKKLALEVRDGAVYVQIKDEVN